MGKADLGEKLMCSSCGARYYDLNKTPSLCPKCGAENARPKVFKSKKAEAAKPVKDEPKPKKAADDDAEDADDIDDIEDEDDDLLNDDDDLDDDDDVGSVIGPIDSDKDSDN